MTTETPNEHITPPYSIRPASIFPTFHYNILFASGLKKRPLKPSLLDDIALTNHCLHCNHLPFTNNSRFRYLFRLAFIRFVLIWKKDLFPAVFIRRINGEHVSVLRVPPHCCLTTCERHRETHNTIIKWSKKWRCLSVTFIELRSLRHNLERAIFRVEIKIITNRN